VSATAHEYLVSHGNTGGFGRFAAVPPLTCHRGERVVVESARGLEMGEVLCSATPGHVRLLVGTAAGRLLRRATPDDECDAKRFRARSHQLCMESRALAADLGLPLEVLDAELLLDGRRLILQHLAWAECDATLLVNGLAHAHDLVVRLESLAMPAAAPALEEEQGGCGQPGCGRASGGGCTSCGSGGCSSCGSGGVDLRAYFAHLRGQMEQYQQRTSLL
jgi:hypothetical protein